MPYFAVADGNNGVNVNKPNIGMPCSNTVCATFNRDLTYNVGRAIAEEAKENNIQMILAPAMNIQR
jgi:beta-glucosidase